jgi:hypothetical protein
LPLIEMISVQTFTETFAAVNHQAIWRIIYLQSKQGDFNEELQNKYSAFLSCFKKWINRGIFKDKLGTAQTELVQGDALEIQRIYVLEVLKARKWDNFY